jgi:hypothetical protein
MFTPEWESLYPAMFGTVQHCASKTDGNVAEFTFEDPAVKPANLGPLVIVEVIPNP